MRYKITKHGKYFEEPEDIIICPECGFELSKNDKKTTTKSEWVLFGLLHKEFYSEKCTCQNCHCEFESKLKSRIKDADFDLVADILAIALVIVGLLIMIIGAFISSSNVMFIIGVIMTSVGYIWTKSRL